jgi:thioesterase domain-containing protein
LVFFLPPADGDTPLQAQFRAAFHNQIRFEVVQYPQWREMIDAGAEFGVLIEAAVSQILATSGDDICLAGYSFGGFVAWEAARRLMELNRRVSFVGLIDTQPEFQSSLHQKVGHLVRNISLRRVSIAEVMLAVLAKKSAFQVLRRFGHLAAHLPATAAFKCHYHLNYQLRAHAMYRWRLKPVQAPIYLFRTDEFLPTAAESAWGALANRLEVISVGGDHESILRPPAREILCRQILRVVNAAERANTKSLKM